MKRFTLRTLFAIVTLAAVACAAYGLGYRRGYSDGAGVFDRAYWAAYGLEVPKK